MSSQLLQVQIINLYSLTRKRQSYRDEVTLRGVPGNMDHEDITVQPYHSEWEKNSSAGGETRGDEG